MRWAALAGQLLTIVAVHDWMGIDLPLEKMLAVIGLAATTNVALCIWLRRSLPAWPAWAGQGEWVSGSLMMLDNLFLTVLLYYSGGPSNPFTVFYLVNIALAAAILPAALGLGARRRRVSLLCAVVRDSRFAGSAGARARRTSTPCTMPRERRPGR